MDKENKKDNTPQKANQTEKDNQKEEKNKKEDSTKKTNPKKESPKKKNIFQKHPLTFLLIGGLLISVFWGFLKANRVEKQLTKKYETHIDHLHEEAKHFEKQLTKKYETHIDHLHEETGLQLSRTLSWSLRSELNRENQESAESYMVNFLKGNLNIQSVKYIDSKSKKVAFSTNKKDEGKSIEDSFILDADEAKMEIKNGIKVFACPVFGYDSQLGTVVFEWIPTELINEEEVKEEE